MEIDDSIDTVKRIIKAEELKYSFEELTGFSLMQAINSNHISYKFYMFFGYDKNNNPKQSVINIREDSVEPLTKVSLEVTKHLCNNKLFDINNIKGKTAKIKTNKINKAIKPKTNKKTIAKPTSSIDGKFEKQFWIDRNFHENTIDLIVEHRRTMSKSPKQPINTNRKMQGVLKSIKEYSAAEGIPVQDVLDEYLQHNWLVMPKSDKKPKTIEPIDMAYARIEQLKKENPKINAQEITKILENEGLPTTYSNGNYS